MTHLEEKADQMEVSERLKHAVEIKPRDVYASMFNADVVDERAGKSKIWLALNPMPIARQTAADRRRKEEDVIEIGLLGVQRNFNVMRDVLQVWSCACLYMYHTHHTHRRTDKHTCFCFSASLSFFFIPMR